jgi:methyl-accepting chemotaxis protein
MSTGKKSNGMKRRQYYIKKGFQTGFILKFFLILVLGAALSIGLTLFTTQNSLTSTYVDSRLVIQNTAVAIMPSVIYTTLITTFVIGIVVVLFTLLVSHKIAGPIFRFEKDIHRVAEGDLKNRIRIREDDQFQELAVSLNSMIDALAAKVSLVKKEAENFSRDNEAADRIKKTIDENFRL